MASIHREGKGFVVRWREAGRNRSRNVPTHAAARELQREVETAIALGRRWEPAALRRAPDVGEVAEQFIRSIAVRRATSTVLAVASSLDHWMQWLETTELRHRKRIDEVFSSSMLEQYAEAMASRRSPRTGRPLETSTIHEYLGHVERFWLWVYERDEYEPFAVRKPRRLRPELARPPSRAVLAPTWSQMAQCVAHLRGRQQLIGVLLYYTGLRINQVMHLEWRDVDLEQGVLEIRGELGKTAAERRGRRVPISPHLVAELRGLEREPDTRWLVPSAPGALPRFERFGASPPFTRAWKLAKVPPDVWRRRPHHAFRAGYETGLLALGVAYEHAEFLVGHVVESDVANEVLLGNALRGAGSSYVDLNQLPLRAAVNRIPSLAQARTQDEQHHHAS